MQKNNQKILAVVGPTATGKTAFALNIGLQALQLPHGYSGADLISVDSRQVYKGLEIISGADIPEDFRLVDQAAGSNSRKHFEFPYYKHKNFDITLHGVSMISVNQEWSVTHFKDFATQIILHAFENSRLPILVGGTGLYQQHLFNSDESLYIPPNDDVRRMAAKLSVQELSEWLFKVDPEFLVRMTDSDVDNPRRLVRAIEKAVGTKRYFVSDAASATQCESEKLQSSGKKNQLSHSELIVIGLLLPLEKIQEKISRRVAERFDQGAVNEVKKLQTMCKNVAAPVCSTLGVKDISEFLNGSVSREDCQKDWSLHEYQYAKRQLTWFKKQENVIWLDELQKKQYTLGT